MGNMPQNFYAQIVEPLLDNKAEAVFGSRMLNKRSALTGRYAEVQVDRQSNSHLHSEQID